MRNTKRLDLVIIAILILVAIYSSYRLFWSDIASVQISDNALIGKIASSENSVKFKSSHGLSWFDAQMNQLLQQDDKIYTNEGSVATVILNSGVKIDLSENTLIKVVTDSINLDKGQVVFEQPAGSQPISLVVAGKKIVMDQSGAKLKIKSSLDKVNIDVVAGKVNVDNGTVEGNSSVSFDTSNAKPVIQTFKHNLIFPALNQIFKTTTNKNIAFNISHFNDQVLLQVANSESFESVVYRCDGEPCSFDFNIGEYYWRVIDKKSSEVLSLTSQFSVKSIVAPKLISFTTNEEFVKSEEAISIPVRIEGEFDSYQINVFKGDKSAVFYNTSNSFSTVELKEIGQYSLQITGFNDEDKLSVDSQVVMFEVVARPTVSVPIITAPKDGQKVISYQDRETVRIMWNQSSFLNDYKVKIVENNQEREELVHEGRLDLVVKKSATFSVSVASKLDEDNYSDFSPTINFEVEMIELQTQPENGQQLELLMPSQKVSFEWQKTSEQDRYLFELSRDSDFSQIVLVKEEVSSSTSVVFPDIGIYYWRIKIIKDGKTSFSPPKKIIVAPVPAPSAPKIKPQKIKLKTAEFPFFKKVLSLLVSPAYAQEYVAEIEWDKYENAKSYLLEIYPSKVAASPILSTQIESNKFLWKNPLSGSYFWRLAIIDHWGRVGKFSELEELIIEPNVSAISPQKPTLTLPIKKAPNPVRPTDLKELKEINLKVPSKEIVNKTDNNNKVSWAISYLPTYKIFQHKTDDLDLEIKGLGSQEISLLSKSSILNTMILYQRAKCLDSFVCSRLTLSATSFNFRQNSAGLIFSFGGSIIRDSHFVLQSDELTREYKLYFLPMINLEWPLSKDFTVLSSIGLGTAAMGELQLALKITPTISAICASKYLNYFKNDIESFDFGLGVQFIF